MSALQLSYILRAVSVFKEGTDLSVTTTKNGLEIIQKERERLWGCVKILEVV